MRTKYVGEIRDPVHGYISMTALERDLINTSTVQRLRRLKQLSGAYFTYPGAEHSRFLHSIGVMHIAGRIAARFVEHGYMTEDDCQTIRVAGLLHDIGHGPFSHMFEEVLDKYRHMTHEDVGEWLIRQGELKDILTSHGYNPTELSRISVGKLETTEKAFLNQIVASQFDADIIDYLVRDSYFAGVQYGNIDVERLTNSLDLVEGSLAMDVAALYALEAFVIARYEMFKAVYFHRTVRAAEVMIVRAMDYANEYLGFTSFQSPEEFLRLDDQSVVQNLRSIKDTKEKRLLVARELEEMYYTRRLFKAVHQSLYHQKDDLFANIMNREDIRLKLATEIGERANVDPDYVIIDVPTVASVPYYPLQKRPSDLPVFRILPNGRKELHDLSEYSPIVNALIGYIDVVRVYTAPQYTVQVTEAASKVLGKQPYSSRITM
ncbi:HD domain-containing protein [Candidatus Bathyarchaeota archaeon]|nr:HD domain-containing protein [Candidatus Bathyarchaeota archaeon]